MQIKVYEEKRKDGETGRLLIILDEPGATLADFVKAYIKSVGGTQQTIETVAPGILDPIPEEPEREPDVSVNADASVMMSKPAAPKAAEPAAEKEEIFPDAPVPEPKAKTQPAAKPEAKKEAPKPAAEPAPAEEKSSVRLEIEEEWELLDEASQEGLLADFGVGSLDDIEEDELPTFLDMIREIC